jgi:hypothetical protein
VFTLLTSLTTALARSLAALCSVTTGALQFAAVKGKDIFLNESEAVAYLKANYQLKNATYVHVLCSPTPPIVAGSPTLEPMILILFIITTHVFYICSLFIFNIFIICNIYSYLERKCNSPLIHAHAPCPRTDEPKRFWVMCACSPSVLPGWS